MTHLAEEERVILETIVRTEADLAEKEKIKTEKTANHAETTKDKVSTERYLESIKPGCDYMDQNLDIRKQTRRAEKSAMAESVKEMQGTPEYQELEHQAELDGFGECKAECRDGNQNHVDCKACLAETTVAGYCASHENAADVEGCEEHVELR